jgi:hypothetical protein
MVSILSVPSSLVANVNAMDYLAWRWRIASIAAMKHVGVAVVAAIPRRSMSAKGTPASAGSLTRRVDTLVRLHLLR